MRLCFEREAEATIPELKEKVWDLPKAARDGCRNSKEFLHFLWAEGGVSKGRRRAGCSLCRTLGFYITNA